MALPFLDEYVAKEAATTLTTECAGEACAGKHNNEYWEARLDPLQDVLRKDNYARLSLNSLTKFIAVLRGEDPAGAIAVLGQSLAAAVDLKCEAEGVSKCEVPVKSKHIRRAFTVLTALGSYAASYRAATNGETAPDSDAREEERKMALEGVIDAFTDRSHRAGDFVILLGAEPGFQSAWMASTRTLPEGEKVNFVRNVLTLPMGLAFQRLPTLGDYRWSWSIMLTLVDPAQYATMNNWGENGQFTRGSPMAALHPGLKLSMLLGDPSFPVSLGLHGGHTPALELVGPVQSAAEPMAGTEVPRVNQNYPVWTFGLSAGIFVPFLDLN
jgi:hypothetical protein